MARYGEKAGEKVEEALHEMHEGTLESGKSGKKVTSRKQAIAIGLSEAREEGGKVPKKSTAKKSESKKSETKKSAAPKKAAGKKTAAKKTATKKSAAPKKSTAKKTTDSKD